MTTKEVKPVVIIEYDRVLVESVVASGPPLDHLTALGWVIELDDGVSDVQPLLWIEFHLIVRVFELEEMLDLSAILSRLVWPLFPQDRWPRQTPSLHGPCLCCCGLRMVARAHF